MNCKCYSASSHFGRIWAESRWSSMSIRVWFTFLGIIVQQSRNPNQTKRIIKPTDNVLLTLLYTGWPLWPPPEQNQLLCIRYCILRDPDWLTIPIYPYIWQFFLFRGQKLSRKSFRVPFLRQKLKSKILNFKEEILPPSTM